MKIIIALHLLVDCDNFRVACVALGETQCQVIRLRAAIYEKADGQGFWHRFGHFLGAMYHLIVQESVVRRQRFHLASPSLHHLWMAMTHCIMGGKNRIHNVIICRSNGQRNRKTNVDEKSVRDRQTEIRINSPA